MKKIEIKAKNKNNEKKGGLFGFLRGGASTTGNVTPGVIGGTAQASSGLAALFTGKMISTLVAVAVMGAAGVTYISRNADMGGASNSEAMMASAQEAEAYVPAIQRSEAANEGKSSLGMFNETNKGAISFDIDPTLNNKNKGTDPAGYDENADGYSDGLGSASSAEAMAAEAMAGATGERPTLNSSNLSSSFGDKSSKSMNMSSSAPRLKPTFKSMASNNFKPMGNIKNGKGGKALAMSKANRANTVGTMRAGSRSGARGARGQARAMLSMMRQSVGARNYEASRATADAAWEGTTNEGEAAETVEAGGLGDGEGMTVDPIGTGAQGSSNGGKYEMPEASDFNVNTAIDETPWQGELTALQLLFSSALVVIGIAAAGASAGWWGYLVYGIMAAVAAAMCAAAAVLAGIIMFQYGQYALGGMWMGIATVGLVGCILAAIGGIGAASAAEGAVLTGLQASCVAIGMIVGLAGGLGTTIAGTLGEKTVDADAKKEYCQKHPDDCKSDITSSLPYELSDSPVVRNNIA